MEGRGVGSDRDHDVRPDLPPDLWTGEEAEDEWLVDKVRDGNLEAFEVLVGRHRERIFRIALRTVGDREDAEDVTQDVVVQMWVGLAAFSGRSSFTTWLHRVVVNRCLNRLRARKPTAALPGPGEPEHPRTPGTAERVQDRTQLTLATKALEALPPDQRTVFVLCQLEGLSYREVAEVRGLSEAAVRGRLSRARAALAQAMREWT